MDAFRVVKYLNFLHEEGSLKKSEISMEAINLLSVLHYEKDKLEFGKLEELLKIYRKLDKQGMKW